MANDLIRVGIIGLGGNCRLRHVPGLRSCRGVEITAVSNRRPESTAAAAAEFGIPKTYGHWRELVNDPDIDAIVIGTWPYLHCPITLAALEAGKHVLTEARMALNAAEARQMLAASREHGELVCQVVPSPFGLRAHRVVLDLLQSGFIGKLREVVVFATSDHLADAETPISWRQVRELSGLNMLTLGIIHETVMRWVPPPVRVQAQVTAFVGERLDPATGIWRRVGTPDSVHVLAALNGGAHAIYHVSGVARFGMGTQVHLYGSEGALRYELAPEERLLGARRGEPALREIEVPAERSLAWDVEAEFIGAIRHERRIEFSDFATGVQYMEFTEAVARSAATGMAVKVPLEVAPAKSSAAAG
ncbi:MAG TPA: Gfo/Idh/MocA family oxidoreductase [Pirellulales bacterium]|nr:Gfo/Idh/MocA family oxidoreductase [Pirellulales bacterium]